ncbi:hypothetical protein [uncultured Maricaulis sp.]|uniref:hypothetical protein n=1 Tax=uncultured Maricaulis sp. TaxID=174710 RepID=UPI002631A0E4|nr:hypothetical protein [uncultured Maricaulis sp.]
MKLHHRLIELVVAVSVVVISLASLFVAVYQGIVMDRTMKASVMPVVQVDSGNIDDDRETWVMTINVKNTGLGPAEIRYFNMYWNGEIIRDTSALMARCCLPETVPADERLPYVYDAFRDGQLSLVFDNVQRRFLAPQEDIDYIAFDRPDADTQPRGRALWDALDDVRHDITYEVCYCSVFDDCWRARFPEHSREPVRQCVGPDEAR